MFFQSENKKCKNKSFLFVLAAMLLSLELFGCKNFLEGSNLSDSIGEKIALLSLPSNAVRVYSVESETIPSGDVSVKETEKVDISCVNNPFSDYAFVRWQVANRVTGKVYSVNEYKDFIEFEDENSNETTFTLKKQVSDLLIQPLCAPRPKVIAKNPAYSATGVYRDSRIVIMFDQEMQEDSIYFTAEEIKELTAAGNTLLSLEKEGKTVYYGYKNPEGFIYYKNISVKNADNEQSILNYFEPPYFDASHNLLVIKAKSENEAPNSGTSINVELTKNFFYMYEKIPVEMSGMTKWNYRVNSFTDSKSPDIEDCIISTIEDFEIPEQTEFDLTVDNLKNLYLKESKFNLFAKFIDEGSGPKELKVYKQRVYDETYTAVFEKSEKIETKDNINIIETTAYFGKFSKTEGKYKINDGSYSPAVIDLSDDKDGVYLISVSAADVCGNESDTRTFYVLKKDTVSKAVSEFSIFEKGKENYLSWKNSIDIDGSEFQLKKGENYLTLSEDNKKSVAIVTLEDQRLLNNEDTDYTFITKDIFGNEDTVTLNTKYIPEVEVENNQRDGINNYSVRFSWNKDENKYEGAKIYYGISRKSLQLCKDLSVSDDGEVIINNLQDGTMYYFRIEMLYKEISGKTYSIDFSYILPLNIKSEDRGFTVNWTDSDNKKAEIYYKKQSETEYSDAFEVEFDSKELQITGLEEGTTYDIKIIPENAKGTIISKSTWPIQFTINNFKASTDGIKLLLKYKNIDSEKFDGLRIYLNDNPIYYEDKLKYFDIPNEENDGNDGKPEVTLSENVGEIKFTKKPDGIDFVKGTTYYFRIYSYCLENNKVLLSDKYTELTRNTVPNELEWVYVTPVLFKEDGVGKTSSTLTFKWEVPKGNYDHLEITYRLCKVVSEYNVDIYEPGGTAILMNNNAELYLEKLYHICGYSATKSMPDMEDSDKNDGTGLYYYDYIDIGKNDIFVNPTFIVVDSEGNRSVNINKTMKGNNKTGLGAPENVKISYPNGKVKLSWDPVRGAVNYKVEILAKRKSGVSLSDFESGETETGITSYVSKITSSGYDGFRCFIYAIDEYGFEDLFGYANFLK